MKKAKSRTAIVGSRKPSPAKGPQASPTDLAEVRRQIRDLVGNGAIAMVENTIEEIGKGHYLGMKYLFEMIGLYPATSPNDATVPDSLAAVLLRRLGLSETPMPEQRVTNDSGKNAAVTEDGLE
jgi:hypothetical protein